MKPQMLHALITGTEPFVRQLGEDQGQDLAEYAMLASLIVVVVIVSIVALGGTLSTFWVNIANVFAALP